MPVSGVLLNTSAVGAVRGERYSVLVVGHRGFSGTAPENTMSAFRAAVEAGCDMIELDARLSQDGMVVVIHDETLERTTNGGGKVAERTFAELRRLDAGAWFDRRFAGERIPSLAEVLSFACNRVLVNIELKKSVLPGDAMPEIADLALCEVLKADMAGQVVFSSFDPVAVDRIHEKNPLSSVALIVDKPWTTPEEAGGGKIYPALNCRASVLNGDNIGAAHKAGVRIFAWTLNLPGKMARLIALGVDGIVTNRPDRLIRLLKQK